ncbi:sugar phosphate isomerase/epimerase [uncultured Anaerococcus sp.]|uniref:sugar phosphate isomerase/epimerase family protein n=1 Tax=uncultured Anaerococcus sp. TaxID=293428 RepID=UPI0025F2B8E3|nr:sugar phosphate isomerase/epimerase [uncultured Anaerococcus sp.]
MSKHIPLTLSSWTLGDEYTFEQRVKAASQAGFDGIGLRAENYIDAIHSRLRDADLLEILNKYQIKVTEVESITQWADDDMPYEMKYKEQICYHMCRLFDVDHINVFLLEEYPLDYISEKLKSLCLRAGDLKIALEPMPYSGIYDYLDGYEIIKKSGMDNAYLILDNWHWVKADHNYNDILPREISEKVISIQLNDSYKRSYAQDYLRTESMHDRLLPNHGQNNTSGFVEMIKKSGVNPQIISVEVNSDDLLSMGIYKAAKLGFGSTKNVLNKSRPDVLR